MFFRGAYGTVVLGQWKGEKCAVKVINKYRKDYKKILTDFENSSEKLEFNILRRTLTNFSFVGSKLKSRIFINSESENLLIV